MIFSLKILKNYIYDVIFGAADILSTGSIFFPLPMATALYLVLSQFYIHNEAEIII